MFIHGMYAMPCHANALYCNVRNVEVADAFKAIPAAVFCKCLTSMSRVHGIVIMHKAIQPCQDDEATLLQ